MITANMVKELREATGAGMLDCKKALTETNGNMEEAITWLREKGISKAAKKQTRIAVEGLAKAKVEGNKAVIVEVNSETDFVAKNPEFTGLVDLIATAILSSNVKTVEEVMKLEVEGNTIENIIIDKTATIGEKLSFRRFELVEKEDNQVFGTYSHMGGKIVTLAVLEGTDEEVAKDVAMQIAAMRPLYLDKDSVPTERVEKEREILTEQAENEGLDANKLPMIVNGRLNKFYEEVCLLDQGFVKENKMKVSKYVESKNMKVLSFVRYEVGEGMEKREENFADEVAKQMNA
jgi:elongation factor Ts